MQNAPRKNAPFGNRNTLCIALHPSSLPVTSVHRLWYEQGDGLIACTLVRHATDTCSVEATQFARSGAGWIIIISTA